MSEWKDKKLCDVLRFGNGKSRPKTIGEYPIYGGNGILGYTDQTNYENETIVIGRVGAHCGAVYFEDAPIWVSDNALAAKPKANNNAFYLYYFLKNLDLNQYALGSSHPLMTQTLLNSIDIEICDDPDEQKAIAAVLSSLDDKIDLLHRQNKTLEAMAETLFRQWFVEEADESWVEKKLSDLLTITSSKRIYYSEYVAFGVPFYRSKEIIELHNSGITKSELYISDEQYNEIEMKFGAPVSGDILMTSVGTLGISYRVKPDDKFYFKDGNLTWFKDFKILPSSIIYLWLNSKIGQEQLSEITIGSTQAALTILGLKSLSIRIPPKEKIKIYETKFDTIINKLEYNQNQIRTLEKLRDTMLPKLMSGEVRVK